MADLFLFLIKTTINHDKSLYCLRRDQSTHCGKISYRSVQRRRRKSIRSKKIYKEITSCKPYTLAAAATLSLADAAESTSKVATSLVMVGPIYKLCNHRLMVLEDCPTAPT